MNHFDNSDVNLQAMISVEENKRTVEVIFLVIILNQTYLFATNR